MKEIILKPEDIEEYDENDPDTFGEIIKEAAKKYIEFRNMMIEKHLENYYKELKDKVKEYERGTENNKES